MTEIERLETTVTAIQEYERLRAAALVAEREVAYGARIAARIGGVAIDVVGGVVAFIAIDAIVNACEKGEYIE